MDELENFDELENEGLNDYNFNLSNVYSVRKGGFGKENGLNTYLTTLTVEELQQDVSFYDTLSKDKNWPVSHIIQREVESERVNGIVKKYLLGKGRLIKFFPPIIVALLPKDTDGNFATSFNFKPNIDSDARQAVYDKSKYKSNKSFKARLDNIKNQSGVDGLFIFDSSTVLQHTLLCWEVDKFFAVVIDGQHRLEALIQARAEDSSMSHALQDVVFIDVSSLTTGKQTLTPVEILRTIFIDINTNAKTVGLVRRILMDDKDLASLCVQSLVESVTKEGFSKESDSYIPSVLIDWDGHSLKHELPYLTGILTLYQTINDELVSDRLVSINDHRDQKKIQYFISLLNDVFFVDRLINDSKAKSDITTLEDSFKSYLKEKNATREIFAEELQEDFLDSILFNYDYRTLEVAQESFENYFLKPIVSVFSDLIPYQKTAKILKDLKGFDQNSNLHAALLLSRRKTYSSANTKTAFLQAREQLMDELYSNYYLIFTVVGQKAIFKCIFDRVWNNYKNGVTPQIVQTVFSDFISQFNKLLELFDASGFLLFGRGELSLQTESDLEEFGEYGIIFSSFWEGILFEDKRIIYNSQGVRAFSDIIDFALKCMNEKPALRARLLEEHHIRYAQQRIKRLIKKRYPNKTENEYENISALILQKKKQFIIDNMITMHSV